jgi:hypothetical protein
MKKLVHSMVLGLALLAGSIGPFMVPVAEAGTSASSAAPNVIFICYGSVDYGTIETTCFQL